MSNRLMILACGWIGMAGLVQVASAQIYVAPRVARYAPVASAAVTTNTTYYQSVPQVSNYAAVEPTPIYTAPSTTTTYYSTTAAPVTSYYAPAPVTTYYAPAATPVTTYYAAPTTVYYSRANRSYYAAPVTSYYAPTTAYYAPTTAYYSPTTSYYSPTTAYYSPTSAYYAPTTAYYGTTAVATPVTVGQPVVMGSGSLGQPKVYVPGQPIRNALRWMTP